MVPQSVDWGTMNLRLAGHTSATHTFLVFGGIFLDTRYIFFVVTMQANLSAIVLISSPLCKAILVQANLRAIVQGTLITTVLSSLSGTCVRSKCTRRREFESDDGFDCNHRMTAAGFGDYGQGLRACQVNMSLIPYSVPD